MTGYSLFILGPIHQVAALQTGLSGNKRPGFTPEISKHVYESNPPLSEYAGVWRENQAVGLYVAQESYKLYNVR